MIARSRLGVAVLSMVAFSIPAVVEAGLPRVRPGDPVVLVLRDSTRVSGTFVDLGRITVEAYRDRYRDWRSSSADAARLPDLGEEVQLGTGRITSSRWLTFVGLGHEGVEVRRKDGPTQTTAFNNFNYLICADDRRLESSWIRKLCASEGTPLVTTLEVAVAEGTRIVPFDDVLGVETRPTKDATVTGPASFTSESSMGGWITTVQAGGLWAMDSEYGLVADGISWRISPTFVTPRVGVDFAVGYLRDEEGDGGGFDMQLALTGTLPVGSRIGIAPRVGAGIILGAGLSVPVTTIGTGLMLRLGREVGLRADYTYGHLIGTGYNYDEMSALQLGVYWGP